MKIILESDGKILSRIELSSLQIKALKLITQDPVVYIVDRIEHILNFSVTQAKQKFSEYKLREATDSELEKIADMIAFEEGKRSQLDNAP